MKEKIKTYIKLNDEFEDLAIEIGNYLDKCPLLWDGCYDAFEKFELDNKNFSVYFYDSHYDLYDVSSFSIPVERIINGTWKDYIDEKNEEKQQKRYETQLKLQKKEEDERRKLYEELKREFE